MPVDIDYNHTMFGEYAQVASYINPDELYGEQGDGNLSYLPSYLLPIFSKCNPWNPGQDVATQDDFIILSEFSEIEGPKPLMTIPRDGGHGFDKNAFSVKIMAVDHQTSTTGFTLSEDTQVILTDSGEFRVSAFVHHFALYDYQARGYVRPFCMAYVTKEERKLVNCYEDLSNHFRKVAKYFKYGNKMVFVKDLEQHAKDLEYTKSHLVVKFNKSSSEDSSSSDETKYKDLHNIQISLEEIQNILSVLKPLLNDKRLENRFYTLESRAWHESHQQKTPGFDTISLQEHWFSDQDSNMSAKYGSYHENTESFLHLFGKHQIYVPKIVETKRKKKFDRALRGLHELCSWGAKEGMKKLRSIYEHFKRETIILELEKEEASLLDPTSTVLSIGQCVTHNVLSCVSLRPADCPYHTSHTKPIDLSQKWSSLDTLEGSMESFKSVVSEESLRSAHSSDSFIISSDKFYDEFEGKDYAVTRTESNTSFSSSITDPSVYESLPSSPVKTPDKPVNTSRFIAETSNDTSVESSAGRVDSEGPENSSEIMDKNCTDGTVNTTDKDMLIITNSASQSDPNDKNQTEIVCVNNENVNNVSPVDANKDANNTSSEEVINTNLINDAADDSSCERAVNGLVGVHDKHSVRSDSNSSVTGLNIGSNSSGKLDVIDAGDISRSFSRQYSEPEDNTDTTHSSSEGQRFNLYSLPRKPRGGVYTIGDLIFHLRQGSPGIGIIQVLNNYNNIQHVIYSLLIGRTVLVIGNIKQETQVIQLVNALSLFLPHHRRKHHSVIEWSSKPLRITDLSRIKLAGVCRSEKRSLDSHVKKYCSILDIEKKVIISPAYQGTVIAHIISKKKNFKTDADFIAYTHCWLMELASKSFIFYHSFCLASTYMISQHSSLNSNRLQYCNSVESFMVKLNIHEGDSPIVEYLTEIIKQIQLDNKQLNDDGCKISPVQLSYRPCQLFRC